MIKFIFSGIAFALAIGIFFMYTQPTYDGTRVLQVEVDQYDQALDKAAELQEVKQTLLSRYNAFNPEDLSRLQKLLPDHVDNVRLVLDLDILAGTHGMALQNVVINAPGSETNEGSAAGSIGGARQKFDSLTLKFSTRASYTAFVAFLEDLESSLRIVDLVSLALAPEATTNDSTEPMYRFDITLKTYWLK
jgi:Tfp pilus assembly protein PilO